MASDPSSAALHPSAPSALTRGPSERWPALPLEPWRDTLATLHMWSQIVGKTRLALAPAVNHWWHTALYVSERGLTTHRISHPELAFSVDFDFIDHELLIRAESGARWSTPLRPRSVADFYNDYVGALRALGLDVRIWPKPVEVPVAIPFDQDEKHGAYDPEAVQRLWVVLAQADRLLRTFRSDFLGKCSPVHFFWGSFDLACTRFSGRRAPQHPGGVPNVADWVTREAYSHECISAGWWPGSPDGPVAEPAFYAYAYPEPAGADAAPIRPAAARYDRDMREWILPYEAVRTADDPDRAVLDFLESTYAAGADLGGWPRGELERART